MHDVIVVGAGVSGLTAGWRLQAKGHDVVIVDARSRVGGRVYSPELAGDRYDLGATWVWDSETSVHGLLQELELATFRLDDSGDDLYDLGAQVERMRGPRSSVAERRVTGGTMAIADALRDRVNELRLGCAVRSITRVDGGLRVSTDDEDHIARHVVAALPPSLVGTEIEVTALDDTSRDRLRQTPTWMSDVAKVVAVYPRRFWRDGELSGRAFSRVGPMVEIHDMSVPRPSDQNPDDHGAALFGFVPRAAATDGWEDASRSQLEKLFGAEARDPIAFRTRAWWSDRETEPALSRKVIPELFGHPWLRKPLLEGRLHLASTETSGVNTGHIDGAVRRGIEVARTVDRALARST